jgi:serine/threonine protein kinase
VSSSVRGRVVAGPVLMDRYELGRHIARGGMGDVFEAQDRQLQRRVAVKLFRGAAPSDRARFKAEAVTLAALNHPGLVQVYDAGEHEGDAFVVLELVEGPTLASRLADTGPESPGEVAELGAQVADALAYVHEHGVVHRDVTPPNILCGPDGRPRLADFGIARLIDTTRLTAPETALGTAAYMAPEQVLGHEVTPAADIYSLGLVLLEMLTGRRAFVGSPHEVAVARLARQPSVPGDIPEVLRRLIREMTHPSVSGRPSAAAVRHRLRTMHPEQLEATDALVITPVVVDIPTGAPVTSSGDATLRSSRGNVTAVLPAELVPDAVSQRRGLPRAVLAAIVGLLLVMSIGMAFARDGEDYEAPSTTTVTQPATTVATTPTTETPAQPGGDDGSGGHDDDQKGEGNSNGKGRGKGKS